MVDAKLVNARYKAYCTGSDYFYCLVLIVLILDNFIITSQDFYI